MKKTSEEIEEDRMNENYKRFSEFWEKARNIVDEEGYKILDWDKSNIANYCFTKGFEQAQKQERLDCYKKELEFLESLVFMNDVVGCDACIISKQKVQEEISQLQQEIKTLEGEK